MGYTLHNNDNAERALVCFEESLSIWRYQLGEDSKEVGNVLNMMGFLKAKKGELDDALTHLWDSLRIRKLGNVEGDMQHTDDAMRSYQESLKIRSLVFGEHDKSVVAPTIKTSFVRDNGTDGETSTMIQNLDLMISIALTSLATKLDYDAVVSAVQCVYILNRAYQLIYTGLKLCPCHGLPTTHDSSMVSFWIM
jgi:tetratricopeptide (TPR) repeat protein